jgi:hypothetical protein
MQVERSQAYGLFGGSRRRDSGGRVSNTWITKLTDRDNLAKAGLNPDRLIGKHLQMRKGWDTSLIDGSAMD